MILECMCKAVQIYDTRNYNLSMTWYV